MSDANSGTGLSSAAAGVGAAGEGLLTPSVHGGVGAGSDVEGGGGFAAASVQSAGGARRTLRLREMLSSTSRRLPAASLRPPGATALAEGESSALLVPPRSAFGAAKISSASSLEWSTGALRTTVTV